mmetsp:Transcript_5169/g.11265  ORF Transcript_5169/g.11265 Transcript_5169/m.11265 type:complete len:862 (-) Transcript_5169:199-2784(-)
MCSRGPVNVQPAIHTPRHNLFGKRSQDLTPTPPSAAKRPCRVASLPNSISEGTKDNAIKRQWRLAEPCAGLPAGTLTEPDDDLLIIGRKAVSKLHGEDCILEEVPQAAKAVDEGDTESDVGSSVALSEGLERLLWSDDEEGCEQVERCHEVDQGAFAESTALVPVPAASESLRSLAPLALDDLRDVRETVLAPVPVLAYGRNRRSGSASKVQAVGAPAPLLALPPAPLTALPPLSVLFEAGLAAFRAANGQAQATPPVPDKVMQKPTDWLYPARPYPSRVWQWDGAGEAPRQGQDGFRKFVQTALERFRSSSSEEDPMRSSGRSLPLQPYQLRVAFLLHPLSPLTRLLVVHATGSGKTRTVLAAADSFFRSGKATCLFFPEEAVKENFYQELLKFPGSWRDFFCASENVPEWRKRRYRCWSAEEVAEFPPSQVEACLGLERKVRLGEVSQAFLQEWSQQHPDVPPPTAPLRAFKYTSAGGSRGGWKRDGSFDASRMDSVFRFGFDGKNPMSNKNLVFDEVHNMLALPRWKGNYWKEPLRRLRKAVADATGSSLVFLTGSPIQTDTSDGHRLLRVLKGREHASAGSEGWLDMHLVRSPEFFPEVYPVGVPDRPLCSRLQRELVVPVDLPEEMEAKYREVQAQGCDVVRLRDCCNLAVHHSWALRPPKRGLVLEASEQHAAKLSRVAKAVWAGREKAMVAISRRGGLQVLRELLRMRAPNESAKIAVFSGHSSCVVDKSSEERLRPSEALQRFNDNSHPEVQVLLLDTAFGREGVSALGVGRLHICDVPSSWAEYKQIVGRAIRFGDVKPGSCRSLRVSLWVARLPGDECADEALLAELSEQGQELCAAEDELMTMSITGGRS